MFSLLIVYTETHTHTHTIVKSMYLSPLLKSKMLKGRRINIILHIMLEFILLVSP